MEEAIGVGRFARYLIEPHPVGVYLFIWETTESTSSDRDYLLDSVEDAKEAALEDYQVPLDSWRPFVGKSMFE